MEEAERCLGINAIFIAEISKAIFLLHFSSFVHSVLDGMPFFFVFCFSPLNLYAVSWEGGGGGGKVRGCEVGGGEGGCIPCM